MVRRTQEMETEQRNEMRGGKGNVSFLHLVKADLPKNGRVFAQITLPPGASIGKHVHTGETEIFYFLAGEGTAMDDDVPVKVGAGDVLITPSGHSHSVENTGDVELSFLAVIILD